VFFYYIGDDCGGCMRSVVQVYWTFFSDFSLLSLYFFLVATHSIPNTKQEVQSFVHAIERKRKKTIAKKCCKLCVAKLKISCSECFKGNTRHDNEVSRKKKNQFHVV
jgi:hypothetical protein